MRKYLGIIVVIVSVFVAFAQEQSDLANLQAAIEQRKNELLERQSEIKQIESELGDSKLELDAKIAARDMLSNELSELQAEIKILEAEITSLSNSIDNRDIEISVLESQFEKLRIQVSNLLRYLYRSNGTRFSQAFSQVNSLHDIQVKNYYLKLLSKRDLELIDKLEKQTNTLVETQQLQRQQLNQAKQKREDLANKQLQLVEKQKELESLITELESSQKGRLALRASKLKEQAKIEASIAQSQKDLAELKRQLEEKKRQAARAQSEKDKRENAQAISKLESQIAARQKELPELNSSYIYPIENPSLQTKYGKGFYGLALAASRAGAPVFAAQAGVVQDVTNMGANDGYMVTILHADGITTAYLNLQNPVQVEIGNTVKQKQTIGYLGGGSLTKSNILKFFTYNGGNPVNPAKILGF